MHFRVFSTLLLLSLGLQVFAQTEVPFTRGVNLTNWFQAGNAYQIQAGKYTLEDFQQIQSLGVDVIRLPINLHAMTNGSPNYKLDPLFLEFLDQAVDWAELLGIYLILDNHTFDPAEETDPNIGPVLETVWTQMAEHYKERSEYVMFEILNEPHGISDQVWNNIQQGVVDAIRQVDQDHYIIIGPAGWNSFHNLDAMPVYNQDKLIYTFHFYDPFIFTHQGASWTNPTLEPLAGVPFPYDAANMPVFPPSLTGTWIESNFNNYQSAGTAASVRSLIDIAARFRDSRNVMIFCGEFGAYIPNSDNDHRVAYYQTVRQFLEDSEIPWTMWDYHGGFGLYQEGGNGLFDHDLNVELLEALEMNVPSQTPYVQQPESDGFLLYTDQIAENILEASSGGSLINYYSEDSPNNGRYCVKWERGTQYQYIGLNLSPTKDMNQLVTNGYALDFLFRGNQPFRFDVRFLDTDTGANDLPWRMRYTIDESVVPFDGRWHHLHIPLADFTEGGAWEGEYYPPEGKFDWTQADLLQIIAEYEDMDNAKLWFDNLLITDLDTAQVFDTSVFEDLVTSAKEVELNNLRVYPNPSRGHLVISLLSGESHLNADLNSRASSSYQLMDGTGRILRSGKFSSYIEVDLTELCEGIYYTKVSDPIGKVWTKKIVKL